MATVSNLFLAPALSHANCMLLLTLQLQIFILKVAANQVKVVGWEISEGSAMCIDPAFPKGR